MDIIKPTLTAFLCCFLIASCGGGGGGSSQNPPPEETPSPPKEQVTHQIVNFWMANLAELNCKESYEFKADGTFRYESGDTWGAGVYEFENTVEKGSAHELTMTFTVEGSGSDCYGDSESLSGYQFLLFVTFPEDKVINIYADESMDEVIQSLNVVNPLEVVQSTEEVRAGGQLSASVAKAYSSSSQISVLYGPSGMQVDSDGNVIWRANLPMLTTSQTVRYALTSRDSLEPLHMEVTVSAEGISQNHVLSAKDPRGGIFTGNFVGDSTDEVLFLDEHGGLQLYTYAEDSMTLIWVTSIGSRELSISPSEGGGYDQIFLFDEQRVSTLGVDTLALTDVYETAEDAVRIDDVYPVIIDGVSHILTVENSSEFSASLRLITATGDIAWTIDVDDHVRSGRIDAVGYFSDRDTRDVFYANQLWDLRTGENNGQIDTFWDVIDTGDLDGDGLDEIITQQFIISPVTRRRVVNIEQDDCPFQRNIKAIQFDDDAALELLIDVCDQPVVRIFDFIGGDIELKTEISTAANESTYLSALNIDADSARELIWFNKESSGASSNTSSVVVMDDYQSPRYRYSENLDFVGTYVAQFISDEAGESRGFFSRGEDYHQYELKAMDPDGEVSFVRALQPDTEQQTKRRYIDQDDGGTMQALASVEQDGEFLLSLRNAKTDAQLWEYSLAKIEQAPFYGVAPIGIYSSSSGDIAVYSYGNCVLSFDANSGDKTGEYCVDSEEQLGDALVLTPTGTVFTYGSGAGLRSIALERDEETLISDEPASCGRSLLFPDSGNALCITDAGTESAGLYLYDYRGEILASYRIPLVVSDARLIPGSENILIVSKADGLAEVSSTTGDIIWLNDAYVGRANSVLYDVDNATNDPLIYMGTSSAFYLIKMPD